MDLGAFSISLAVEDLAVSRRFYEKLGFGVIGGDAAQNGQILRSETIFRALPGDVRQEHPDVRSRLDPGAR